MSDKDFKVKNKLQVKGITSAGPVVSDASGNLDSTAYVATQYGGTGTSTSPTSGQVLYSSSGTTYAPTTLTSIVTPVTYSADAPSSPVTGQIWVESDSSADSFDPNIIRRQAFTATVGQTVFTTSQTFIDGYEQVYFNGLLLLRTTDYTTSNSNTITLGVAAAANDIIEVVTVTNLNVNISGYTQDSAPSNPQDGQIWLDTDGTLAEASYLTTTNAASTYAPLSNPTFTAIGGSEGGQINLAAAPANTTLSGNINFDVYQNRVRLFEGGGNLRGAYIDLTTLSNGVGSELIAATPQSGNSGKVLTTNGTSASWVSPPAPTNAAAYVNANESTTSTTFADLTTAGPAVTLTTGTKALVILGSRMEGVSTTTRGYMGFAISGATTLAANEGRAQELKVTADQFIDQKSFAYIVTGLTAGSNTFTAKYKSQTGAIVYYTERRISVVDMGS